MHRGGAALIAIALGAAALLAGCLKSSAVTCGDITCPADTRCVAYLDSTLCVAPDLFGPCDGHADGDECAAEIAGRCVGGACLPIGCGNGHVDDPLYSTNEECDDGNRLSHDGCSSACRVERPSWHVSTIGSAPRITDHAMAFEASSGDLLMYGGNTYGTGASSEMWAWSKDAWVRRDAMSSPSPRQGHAVAYDGKRERLVMFGGRSSGTYFADTWEWDGTRWASIEPVHAPSRRADHAMAYDPLRDVTVLFGGHDAQSSNAETWEWDGADWIQRQDLADAPPAGEHQSMTFDPVRGVIVLASEEASGIAAWELDASGWRKVGAAGTGPTSAPSTATIAFDPASRRVLACAALEQMWSWDGSTWTQRAPATNTMRFFSAMAPDGSGHLVRYGGQGVRTDVISVLGEGVRWTTDQWTPISAPIITGPGPGPRNMSAVAYDSDRARVIFFGGALTVTPGTLYADTWELGPGGWRKLAGAGPPARSGHAMAYDARRHQVVMFGDTAGDPATWVWDGTAWASKGATAGLVPRAHGAMAYDASRGVVVLFGGLTGTTRLSDTWEWDGTAWTQRTSATQPAGRYGHAMAYDPIRKRVILFGGTTNNGATAFSDTWAWDGTTWTELAPSSVPGDRFDHGLAWDASRQRLVLVGGKTPSLAPGDVWEWDGATWRSVPVDVGPLSPSDHAVVATDPGGGVVVVGDRGLAGAIYMQPIRLAWWGDTGAYETCSGGDHDRDGLAGCADPDCWATCTPHCPPGTSCDANALSCGDGTCSALESCRTCPADCGACSPLCGDFVCDPGEDCVGDCS